MANETVGTLEFEPGAKYSLYYVWDERINGEKTGKVIESLMTAQFTGEVFDIKDRDGVVRECGEFIHVNNQKIVHLSYERLLELQPKNRRCFEPGTKWVPKPAKAEVE